MRRINITVVFTLITLLFSSIPAYAKERIVKYHESIKKNDFSGYWTGTFRNAADNSGYVHPGLNQLDEARNRDTFHVYTDEEIDKQANSFRSEMETRLQLVKKEGSDAASSMKAELKLDIHNSIEQLPQRLLSDAAQRELKSEVLKELQEQNALLRSEIKALGKRLERLEKNGLTHSAPR